MTLYCDNKGALKNAFQPIPAGITPYFNTDHDLVELAQSLLQILPIIVTTAWVKGHYEGKDKEFKHVLNDTADRLAGSFQAKQTPHHTIRKPLPPPGYRVRLLYDSSTRITKIKSVLVTSMHEDNIVAHILKKSRWTRRVFDKVHWDAHERAFSRLPRPSQYSTAKLIHGLINTNKQNHLYYGQSSMCPICNEEEESVDHVFQCSHPEAVQHCQKCLDTLTTTLQHHRTPQPIIDAISHGFTSWFQRTDPQVVRAQTAGSLRGPDTVLTSAFYEQFREIGWGSMSLGRISRCWVSSVTQYSPTSSVHDTSLQWSSIFIAALWKFSRDLWKFRNEVVHGATIEEQATRQLEQWKAQITQYYTKFHDNPDFVLGRHQFLFQSRSMEERLQASYDTMAAWIRSVEEAIKVVRHHEDNLRELTQVFFPTSHPTDSTAQDSESDSTYTYHSIGSEEDLSLDPTEATTNTMSSAASSASVFTQLIYDSDD